VDGIVISSVGWRAATVLLLLAQSFAAPNCERFVLFSLSSALATGRRTVGWWWPCRPVAMLLRWLADRRFVLVGDVGFGTQEVSPLCCTRRDLLMLVSKLHPKASLNELPPPSAGKGFPHVAPVFRREARA
jgi:hypothetical protein